jgi:hypothetical protein
MKDIVYATNYHMGEDLHKEIMEELPWGTVNPTAQIVCMCTGTAFSAPAITQVH